MKRRTFLKTSLTPATTLQSAVFINEGKVSSKKDIHIGFSSIDINDSIRESPGYRYPLQAKCMTVIKGTQKLMLCALDILEVSNEFCWNVQKQISKEVNIDPQSILIHTTHTHSAPWPWDDPKETTIQHKILAELLTKCAKSALRNARPAKIKTGEVDVGQKLSVYRRGYAGKDLGVQTFWFGYQFREGDDRPDASALANEMKSRWLGKERNYQSDPTPIYFDNPVDPLIQTMYFEDLGGNPLGSIVRFSAHPHLTSSCKNFLFDPDYPSRTRKFMEDKLGGHCIFLLGPCGDLVPKEKVKYVINKEWKPRHAYMGPSAGFYPSDENELLSETERIGKEIGQSAVKAIKKASFQKLKEFDFISKQFDVPLDPNLPKDIEEIKRMRSILAAEYDAFLNIGGEICELRRLANRLNWLDWTGYYSINLLNDKERKAGFKKMPLSVLKLNSIHFIFLHSEPSLNITLTLRKKLRDSNPWTVMLTGGSLQYLPTDKMLDEGGYEGRNTCIARGTETKVVDSIVKMVRGE